MVSGSYNDIISHMTERLTAAGIDNALWEARELAGAALGFDCRGLFDGEKQADSAQAECCEALLQRRLDGEPLQYIIGEWDFYGETFEVGEGVLIPRADTETLIDEAVKRLKDRQGIKAADLCAGTGCIGITIAAQLDCDEVYCVEKYDAAKSYLDRNIKRHNSKVISVQGDVLSQDTADGLPQLDLVISNPPYINAADMKTLQKEVTHEPETALAGGEDGYDFYRGIVRIWSKKLAPDGLMIFEIGIGQQDEVMQIMIQAGLKDVRVRRDMAGIDRCVIGRRVESRTVNLYEELDKRNNRKE